MRFDGNYGREKNYEPNSYGGPVETGRPANLVVFDPDTVGSEPLERVWDLPAGADRLIARSRGIEHVWVNGTAIRRAGEDLDALPGALLRGTP